MLFSTRTITAASANDCKRPTPSVSAAEPLLEAGALRLSVSR